MKVSMKVSMKVNRPAVLRVASAFAVVIIATAGIHHIRKTGGGAPDFACKEIQGQDVSISIEKGATGSDIAQQLFQAKVVKSAAAFFRLAVTDPRSERIAPGTHRIQINLCVQDALVQLLDSKRIADLINIFEGAWNSEIIDFMVSAGFELRDVTKALKQAQLPAGFSNVEGLLFPAQYSFATGTSAQNAISHMLERAEIEMEKSGISSGDDNYSPQELLTIASIIQAEADTKDFAKASRVIRNRLEKGIPLQMDSTVHYIKKVRGEIFLSTSSTLLNSPYNTYRKYGLPPGPIGNPGRAAMLAAVNPVAGDWTFFITVAPGDTRFTSSLDQFNLWKAEYKKNLRAGAFGSAK
jgi:UPF0755 protein